MTSKWYPCKPGPKRKVGRQRGTMCIYPKPLKKKGRPTGNKCPVCTKGKVGERDCLICNGTGRLNFTHKMAKG